MEVKTPIGSLSARTNLTFSSVGSSRTSAKHIQKAVRQQQILPRPVVMQPMYEWIPKTRYGKPDIAN